MKKLTILVSILFVFLLLASNNTFAQQKDCHLPYLFALPTTKVEIKGKLIISRYESSDAATITTSGTIIEKNSDKQCEILQIKLFAGFQDGKISPTDKIELKFTSVSNNSHFDAESDRKLIFQVEKKEVFSTILTQETLYEASNNIKSEWLKSETDLSFALLKTLAEAKSVTIKLGKKTITLTSEQHQAIKDFYNEMNNPIAMDESEK